VDCGPLDTPTAEQCHGRSSVKGASKLPGRLTAAGCGIAPPEGASWHRVDSGLLGGCGMGVLAGCGVFTFPSACCGVAFVWCGGTPPVWGPGLTRTSSTGKHTLKTLQQTLPKIIRRAAAAVVIFFETSGAREEGDRLSFNSCGSLALPSGGYGAAPLLLEPHAPWLVGSAG
jgi:hypothetical protein